MSLINLAQFIVDNYPADPRRMYMLGLSQGGRAVMQYPVAYPRRMAAVAAGPGGLISPYDASCFFQDTALWSLHGENDADTNLGPGVFFPCPIVDFVQMYDHPELFPGSTACSERVGTPYPDARITMYFNRSHNVWTPSFENVPFGQSNTNQWPTDQSCGTTIEFTGYGADIEPDGVYSWMLSFDRPDTQAPEDLIVESDVVSIDLAATTIDDDPVTYTWTQIGGDPVTLLDAGSATATITDLLPDSVYMFEVFVVDADNQWDRDEVTVAVLAVGEEIDPIDDPVDPGEDPGTILETIYTETFDGPDGASWPAPWSVNNGLVLDSELTSARGTFSGQTAGLARMGLAGLMEANVDVTFTVTFDDYWSQGLAFVARQNLDPASSTGYAVYLEGGGQQTLGIWRQLYGNAAPLVQESIADRGYASGVPYAVRYQVFDYGTGQTRLRARVWEAAGQEPDDWTVNIIDNTFGLQNVAGAFSADLYNYTGTSSVHIDDIVISRVADDPLGIGGSPDSVVVTLGPELYTEDFEGLPDGSAWPGGWYEGNSPILSSEVVGGQGRMSGATEQVARMILPGFAEIDVDIAYTVVFEDLDNQGVGLYARQNGGFPNEDPPGEGYGVFAAGSAYQDHFGIWRENDGTEIAIHQVSLDERGYQSGVPYRIRFQCFTVDDMTQLRIRMWPVGDPEPDTWSIDQPDNTYGLQELAGSFALDLYNFAGTSSILVDDIVITELITEPVNVAD